MVDDAVKPRAQPSAGHHGGPHLLGLEVERRTRPCFGKKEDRKKSARGGGGNIGHVSGSDRGSAKRMQINNYFAKRSASGVKKKEEEATAMARTLTS